MEMTVSEFILYEHMHKHHIPDLNQEKKQLHKDVCLVKWCNDE